MPYDLDTDLTTTDVMKVYLGVAPDDFANDGLINDLIVRCSGVVSAFCNRRFAQTTYTDEYYSGNGSEFLWLNNYPITTPGAEIYVDGARKFGSGTLLSEDLPSNATSGDYYVQAGEESHGCVTRLSGVWPKGTGNIKVTYQAGYAAGSIPGALVECVHRIAARAYQIVTRHAHATSSESAPAGGGSISTVKHEIPDDVRETLMRFKKMRVY